MFAGRHIYCGKGNQSRLKTRGWMSVGKIVLVASTMDQDDILEDFIRWHLHLGVDLIIVQDLGSRDRSRAILKRLAYGPRIEWFAARERDMKKYRPGVALAELARDKHLADRIILSDVDQFTCCDGGDLRAVLSDASERQISCLNVPCFNMTGPMPDGTRAIETLTFRIDRPVLVTAEEQLSGELRVPYIFIRHPPHTIVRAAAFVTYGPGGHFAQVSWGGTEDTDKLRSLHYCMRRYDKLDTKVRNAADFFRLNQHLEPWWGWHWRRWIRLMEVGRLRDDYETQFLSPALGQQPVRDGTFSIDDTVARWSRFDRRGRGSALGKLFGHLFGRAGGR